MSTTIRPETSKKNTYWIERHRYFELKHFCLQYPIWKQAYSALDGFCARSTSLVKSTTDGEIGNPTAKHAEARIYFYERMQMIDQAAKNASLELSNYIVTGVTEGLSYEHLKARLGIPCCKETYYNLYRRFFWLLSKARK